ncbi:MAG: hypothetical protein GX128_04350 [Bacteroidales bacterium]|nr:hypothetical protein [Bacteroidales bacterium]
MIQQIIISYGAWFIPLCVLLALLYAGLLYFRERRYEFSAKHRLFMSAIRAVVVFFLAFMLLSPFFRSTSKRVEDPVIIIAQDNSLSVTASGDTSFYKQEYPKLMNDLVTELGRDFEVQLYSLGQSFREGISYDFSDKQTNISEALTELNSRYLNRNVGALILASDGIFNQGVHPHYALEFLPFPVYTLALGDTIPVRDAAIVNVTHNRIAYLENTFPVEIHVRGVLCNGMNTNLRIIKNGVIIFSERIVFTDDSDDHFITAELKAEQPGIQRYRIEITSVEGEWSILNNHKDVFIEVLEARQKLLMLYNSPHPDISAIRQTVESLQSLEAEVIEASKFNGDLNTYNLVVLHQIPSVYRSDASLLRKINDSGLPILHIIGAGSDLNVFNTLGYGLTITGSGNKTDETLPALNTSFSLFTLSDEFREMIRYFPPLYSPYGIYRESLAGNNLFYRQIGSLVTNMPLVTFSDISGKKIGIIAGEGIWRWRLANFLRKENHQAFQEWLGKTIQYLALREKKERFMVNTRNIWNENEIIEFTAELYNESFEPITTPDVELIITDEDGKQFPFGFSRTKDSYRLNVGQFAPGHYSYSAVAVQPNEKLEAKGAFTILPLQIELVNTVADHRLMHGLASRFGGQMFFPDQMDEIIQIIRARDDVKPVFYVDKSYFELIDIKWLAALIIGLMALEWLFRRIAGGY